MVYDKQTWADLPTRSTPLSASRLNHMEDGIYDASSDARLANFAATTLRSDLTDSVKRSELGVAGITKGTLPDGEDLDTLRGALHAGTYRVLVGNTHPNSPPAQSGQTRSLTVLNSGVADTQIYATFSEIWYRHAPAQVFGAWRRIATADMITNPFNTTTLTTSSNLDTLEPGIYHVNYVSTAVALGLPGRTGRLTVVKTSDGGRIQRYETSYGTFEWPSESRPYEVWVRGMDAGMVYQPTFTKILSTAEGQAAGDSYIGVSHTVWGTRAKATYTASQTFYAKNPDVLDRPASTTKVMTGHIARTVIPDADLDNQVTVLSTDPNPGGSGADIPLKVGDIVTFRDLFHLSMLPSHNQATEVLARAAGDRMPGTGTGRDKFIAKMQSEAASWWGPDRVFVNPTGLGNGNQVTASDLVNLLYRVASDTFLVECMGTQEYTVNIAGPDARTITAIHTVKPDGPVKFPDMVAAKSGTIPGTACLVMLYRKSNGTLGAAALMGSNAENRYRDMRQIINYAKEGVDRQYLV